MHQKLAHRCLFTVIKIGLITFFDFVIVFNGRLEPSGDRNGEGWMSLEEKLAETRAASAKRIPEDKRAVIGRATQELRESGIMDNVIRPTGASRPAATRATPSSATSPS